MLPNADWNSIRAHLNYLPSDSLARFRTDHNAPGWYDVFLRESDNAYFIRQYGEWVALPDAKCAFEGFEEIGTKRLFDTAIGATVEAA